MKISIGIFTVCLLCFASKSYGLGEVKIDPDSSERFVKTGDSLSVLCTVTAQSNQKIKLEWTKPTENEVSITKRTEVKDGVDMLTANLKISSITNDHIGVYKCSYGTSSAQFELLSPSEDKSAANYTYGDNSATLFCKLGGDASSKKVEKVEWLKNDTLVSELTDHKRFTESAENHTLVISDPKREDADLYVARFTFKDMDFPYNCDVPYTAAPLVLDFDKSKNLIEDDTMELQCKVKGYPHAVVTWLKNKKVLNMTDNKRIQLSPLDGYKNAKLIIKSVQFEDAGDYTCKAHSDYFNTSDSKTLVVRVKDKLAALWPFLGIVGEVVILCTIIFIYEKRRNKQAETEANNAQDVDGSTTDKKEGLRHRNTQSNNPTA